MYSYGMYSDPPAARDPQEEREQAIQVLERRIALGLATPERTERRRKALAKLKGEG